MQAELEVDPAVNPYVPAGQAVHCVSADAPTTALYVPAEHDLQAVAAEAPTVVL